MRKIVFFLAFFFSSIGLSFASEFPIDAVTTHYNISSAGTGTLGFGKTLLDVTYFSDSNKTIDFQLSCGGDTIFDTQYHNSLHFPIQRYCSGSLDYAVSGVTATDISLNLTTVSRDISIPVDATIVSSSGSYTQMQPDNNTSVGGVLVDIRAYLMVLLILTIAVSFTSILIWCLGKK